MKVGFIGAGKVGCSLGKFFVLHGIQVTGYYSRQLGSAEQAAEFTKSRCYEEMEPLVRDSDAVFLTVPDGAIKSVYEKIKLYDISKKQICHCSGALSAREVFADIEEKGARGYSIHPLFPVSDKLTSYQEMPGAFFCLEGDDGLEETEMLLNGNESSDFTAGDRKGQEQCSDGNEQRKTVAESSGLEQWKTFFQENAAGVKVLRGCDKVKYHAACAVASNLYCALMQQSLELLEDCGFTEREALSALTPLVESNVKHILSDGPVKAMTGPVERGDVETVRKHIESMTEETDRAQYIAVTEKLRMLAQKKHPERDDTELAKLLEKYK